jgi:S-adenosylmethionine:tRNA-ribosyltransferase-isomerase (queuine synthetase)
MANLSIVRKNKHFVLNQTKLKQAQKVLGTKTETETIEVAIDMALSEAERNQKAWSSHEKFIRNAAKEGLQISDVFGRLENK